ncbi:MAG: hypothetical protein QMD71_03915 [bacterium]|nr:hypothetical protein [bacterium]
MLFITTLLIFVISDPIKDYHILQGIDYIYKENYESARKEFNTLISLYPNDPEGYFYLSSLLATLLSFENSRKMKTELDSIATLGVKFAEEKLKLDNNEYNLFYVGSTRGERAVQRALKGDWIGCFIDGIRARRSLEKALRTDSTIFDIYMGFGLYDYYFGKYILFLRMRKNKGMEELKLASTYGKYAKMPAAFFLLRVYLMEGMYKQADEIIDKLLQIYPENTALLYNKGEVNFYKKNWIESINACKHSLLLSEAKKPRNRRVRSSCYLLLAQTYYKIRDFDKMRAYCSLVMQELEDINEDWAQKLRNKTKRLTEI